MNILSKFCIVFVIIVLLNFISIKSFKYSKSPSPIILVPGNAGSRAYNYDKSAIFQKKTLVWLNLYYLFYSKMLNKVFRLEYDNSTHKTRDAKNANISFPGWGSTEMIETLNDIPILKALYFGTLVKSLIKDKYYIRNKTIRGAPYDFRKAPNENNNFVGNLKQLIEETYVLAGNKRVVLLGHSLGSLYSLYFLKNMSTNWKKKYLRTFISVCAPLGGSVQAVLSETFGIKLEPLGTIKYFREMERSFPSIPFLLPNPKLFKNETLVITPRRNYSAYDYNKLFADMSMPHGGMMYNDSKDLLNTWETPEGIDEIYCIYSKGINTSKQLIFTSFPDVQPQIINEDGDGTVGIRSLEICRNWKNTQYEIFDKVDHIKMVQNSNFINKIKNILYEQPNFQFQFDKIMPNIL